MNEAAGFLEHTVQRCCTGTRKIKHWTSQAVLVLTHKAGSVGLKVRRWGMTGRSLLTLRFEELLRVLRKQKRGVSDTAGLKSSMLE